jgi:hypothetical protein
MSKIEQLKLKQDAVEAEAGRISNLIHENMMKKENEAARLEYIRVYEEWYNFEIAYTVLDWEAKKAVVQHTRQYLSKAADEARKKLDIACVGQEAYDARSLAHQKFFELQQLIVRETRKN